MQIHELTRQTPGTSSNLIFDTGSATYRALVSDVAATIIEQYAGSTIAGSAQTLQTAINALNANKYELKDGIELTTTSALNSLITPGIYYANGATATTLYNGGEGDCPVNVAFRLRVEQAGPAGGTSYRQTISKYTSDEDTYVRRTSNSGSSWTSWKQTPITGIINQLHQSYKTSDLANTTKTFALTSAFVYLLVIGNINSASATSGLYLIAAQTNNSNLNTILEASSNVAVVSVDKLTLTIEYKKNYVATSLIRLA